ncbi:hypothetical protein [Rubrivirga sp. IMCC45206]|uniref:hypothetical protein n=1 Tax=Rubrivirga sp. IMCC45206 TaxID=3391614 RepID=UPI00398FC23C
MRLALVALLALAACADAPSDAAAPPTPPLPASGPSFTVGVDSLLRAEPERRHTVAIGYPQIRGMSGPPMASALRAVNAAIRDTVAAFAADFRPAAPPALAGPPEFPIRVTGGPERVWISDDLFSALVEVAVFTGGADANTAFLPLTYDLTTGRPVASADLFAPGTPWAEALADAVERAVVEQIGAEATYAAGLDALRAGRIDWTLAPDSIVVHVLPNQLSAVDPRAFHIGVPLAVVAPFVRPGGVLARDRGPTGQRPDASAVRTLDAD